LQGAFGRFVPGVTGQFAFFEAASGLVFKCPLINFTRSILNPLIGFLVSF
jgi:hypothetical protein